MSATERQQRLLEIGDRIAAAASRSGRSQDDVTLIAVSKTFPEDAILEIADAGQRAFGENKVQELIAKTDSLGTGTTARPLEWHFIGHLQRNKAKDVVGRAALFHALDSERLGRELQKRLAAIDATMACLIQVNVSGEDSKFGVNPQDLDALLDALASFDRLQVKGLMTLASPAPDPELVRQEMVRMRELAYRAADRLNDGKPLLSMGMSGDYEVAIEEGATHVRIGSAIFGAR